MFQHTHSSPISPKRVVVLGANGFVGRYATEALAAAEVQSIGTSTAELDLTAADAVSKLSELINSDDVVLFISALCPDRGTGRTGKAGRKPL